MTIVLSVLAIALVLLILGYALWYAGYQEGHKDGVKHLPQKDIDIYNWGYKDGYSDAEKYRDTIYDKRINK